MSRSRKFGIAFAGALLAATLLLPLLIGGSLWPVPPEIIVAPAPNEDPYSMRYSVSNSSAVFALEEVVLACEMPRFVTRVATSLNVKASGRTTAVTIRPLQTVDYRCPVNRNIRVGVAPVVYTTTVVGVRFSTLGISRSATSGSFHWVAETRQWRAGNYGR